LHGFTDGVTSAWRSRRLGACLRKLRGPSDMLTTLLGGDLDADKLMMM
jgi:hypothetical protein